MQLPQRIAEKLAGWRAAGYPHEQFPAIAKTPVSAMPQAFSSYCPSAATTTSTMSRCLGGRAR